jgi:hypothetical protein
MSSKFEEALQSSGLFQQIKESEKKLTEEREKKGERQKKTPPKPKTVSKFDTASIFDTVSYSHPLIEEILQRNGNQTVAPTSGYTTVWAVDDVLAPLQTPAEQCVYRQLYRLSFGLQNTTCCIGQGALARRCNVSKGTVRIALVGLLQKKHIAELETVNQKEVKGTVYRVFLPSEIDGVSDMKTASEMKAVTHSDTDTNFDTVLKNDTVLKSVVEKSRKK